MADRCRVCKAPFALPSVATVICITCEAREKKGKKGERQGRGMLTQRVKDKAKELLDWDMTIRELRMLPYIQYTMINNQRLNPMHYHREDIKVMKDRGWVDGGATGLTITKEFWDAMNQIIFLAYVDTD